MMVPKLQIFILCRDRAHYAEKAIASVLASATPATEVVISDNSVGESIAQLHLANFPDVKYVRRAAPCIRVPYN